MATLAGTSKSQNGAFAVTKLALGASDTFTYVPGSGQQLLLWNTTGSPVTVNIAGSGTTPITPVGASAIGGSISVSGGLDVVVAAIGATVGMHSINLDNIAPYLTGTIAVTGGTGVTAMLLNV